jgi:hypothetical protein
LEIKKLTQSLQTRRIRNIHRPKHHW